MLRVRKRFTRVIISASASSRSLLSVATYRLWSDLADWLQSVAESCDPFTENTIRIISIEYTCLVIFGVMFWWKRDTPYVNPMLGDRILNALGIATMRQTFGRVLRSSYATKFYRWNLSIWTNGWPNDTSTSIKLSTYRNISLSTATQPIPIDCIPTQRNQSHVLEFEFGWW